MNWKTVGRKSEVNNRNVGPWRKESVPKQKDYLGSIKSSNDDRDHKFVSVVFSSRG